MRISLTMLLFVLPIKIFLFKTTELSTKQHLQLVCSLVICNITFRYIGHYFSFTA